MPYECHLTSGRYYVHRLCMPNVSGGTLYSSHSKAIKQGGFPMILEQGEVVDEIITKMRSGRMKRRTFLERALAVGLTSSAAISLLEACGGTSNSTGGNGQTVNINYLQRTLTASLQDW